MTKDRLYYEDEMFDCLKDCLKDCILVEYKLNQTFIMDIRERENRVA